MNTIITNRIERLKAENKVAVSNLRRNIKHFDLDKLVLNSTRTETGLASASLISALLQKKYLNKFIRLGAFMALKDKKFMGLKLRPLLAILTYVRSIIK